MIRGALSTFLIALITFYAGVFVWQEREAKLDEIVDALPIPTWLPFIGKYIALSVVIGLVIGVGVFCGLLYQLFSRFFDFQVDVYVVELLLIDGKRRFRE